MVILFHANKIIGCGVLGTLFSSHHELVAKVKANDVFGEELVGKSALIPLNDTLDLDALSAGGSEKFPHFSKKLVK
jgi:hypothetical protein